MKLGLTIFLTDRVIDPTRLAREAEARGFHSLYFPEHTHIPVARNTPHPSQGRDFAESYRRTFDPYIAGAFAAAVTTKLRVGTGVSLVAEHDPITLAKEIASLDLLSGGRFTLGIGYGWNHDELADHGVNPKARRSVVREYLLAMTQLWSEEEATFSGEHVSFPPSWAYPKPIQQPRPRTLIGGGGGPALFAHVAEFADGWAPMGGSGLGQSLPLLRKAFSDAGRDPETAEVVPFGTSPTQGKLDYYESIGVREVVAALPEAGVDEILPILDGWAKDYPRFLA